MTLHAAITVRRPIDEVFAYWADLTHLPDFMTHLDRVEARGDGSSHWRAKAPRVATSSGTRGSVGATMAQHDCSAAQALAMLRAESTQEHLALGDVARRILRELHLPPE